MLCLPGLHPVIKEDQATDETNGHEELSGLTVPALKILARLGILPSWMRRVAKLYGTPSMPMTSTRRAAAVAPASRLVKLFIVADLSSEIPQCFEAGGDFSLLLFGVCG